VRIGFRFFLLTLVALPLLAIAPAASSDVAATQIVVQGGPGFQTETTDGTVTGSVAAAPGTNPGSYSAAVNGSIAYSDNSGVVGGVWVVNPNEPPVQLDSSPQDSDVAISPDGSKVAFTRIDPATDASDIYVVNADGSNDPTLVASGGGNNSLDSLAFSPDGSTIAYECGYAGHANGTGIGCGPTAAGTYLGSGVMLMNTDGTGQRVILSYIQGDQGDSLSWSPDGKSIAMSGCVAVFSDGNQSCAPQQVFVYATDGSDLLLGIDATRQVTNATGDAVISPEFSPDGSSILFDESIDNQWGLYSVDARGGNAQELSGNSGQFAVVPPATGGGPAATVAVGQSAPSPDGTVIAASWIPECQGYVVETAADAFTSCIQGHGRFGFFSNSDISVSSNDSIVYSDLSADPNVSGGPIWLSRPNMAPVELDSNVNDYDPSISADGSLVTFERDAPSVGDISGGSDIYTINANGTDLKLVASGTGTNGMYLSAPTLSPDGSAIAYVCESIDHSYAEINKFCGPEFDGKYLQSGLMLMNADGSNKHVIVNQGGGVRLSWSPDAQWLACIGGSGGQGPSQVFVYRTDGSDLLMGGVTSRQVTDVTGNFAGAAEPQFSADGSKIMFVSNLDDTGTLGYWTYEINRDGTGQHQVWVAPPDVGLIVPGLFVPSKTVEGGPSAAVAPTQVPVPDVRRMTFRVARARLAQWRLIPKITRRVYSPVAVAHVVSQSPGANKYARLGQNGAKTVVKLVMSRGRRPHHRHR
jgi:Tol biopolymer transport system component